MCFFDPQESDLSAKVNTISNMRKKEFRVAGGAEGDIGAVGHRVILDVFWKDPTSLQEYPKQRIKHYSVHHNGFTETALYTGLHLSLLTISSR